MTKAERQRIIDEYAQRAIAYGWYSEERNNRKEENEVTADCYMVAQGALSACQDVLEALGISPDQDYIAKGRRLWQENHKEVASHAG